MPVTNYSAGNVTGVCSFGKYTIKQTKDYLASRGLRMNL
jgi:hypothetical protein